MIQKQSADNQHLRETQIYYLNNKTNYLAQVTDLFKPQAWMSLSHIYPFSYLFLDGQFHLNPLWVRLGPQKASINETHLWRKKESV